MAQNLQRCHSRGVRCWGFVCGCGGAVMAQPDLWAELNRKLNAQFRVLRQQINAKLYPREGDRERAAERLKEICEAMQ